MAQRERGPHDVVIVEHALVAVDDGRALAAEFGSRVGEGMEHRLLGAVGVERHDFFARGGGDGCEAHPIAPRVLGPSGGPFWLLG